MATSAILVKRALKAKIDAVTPAELEKGYGPPHREAPMRFCMVGEITWPSNEWVTNQRREEVFEIEVLVRVQLKMGTPQDAEDALIAYTDAIEDALKADVKLGQPKVINSNWNPVKQNCYPIDVGSEAVMIANYRVKASK